MSDAGLSFESLLGPDAYPHAVVAPIGHVQTHISHVFLTGEFAYKIKKAVNLGFLDYSGLEQRRRFCEREVALNRQFAPRIYMDVVPVFALGDGYSLVPPGADAVPIEYAVKMRQFREEDVLLRVFERGELSPEQVRDLARKLAAVHSGAETSAEVAAYGRPEAVRAMAAENIEIVRPFIGRTISAEIFAAIETRTLAFFEKHRDMFIRRMESGRIRECHGDLHLNNICRFEGEVQFFDRIEFNERYKNIDVIYDLAFLIMDIQFRGRPDLANILLNEYLERTGDYEAALLLPVYVSMRAFIRGEVQSILAGESEVDDATRLRAGSEAGRYFEHALASLAPADAGVILVGGVSGSGKTFLARELAAKLGAIHVRSDALRKHLAGVALEERGREIYSADQTETTYREMIGIGTRIAGAGYRVILDATWLERERRAKALSGDFPTAVLFCTADREELDRRIRGRKDDVSDATVEVMLNQQGAVEVPTADEAEIVWVIDTTLLDIAKVVDEVADLFRT